LVAPNFGKQTTVGSGGFFVCRKRLRRQQDNLKEILQTHHANTKKLNSFHLLFKYLNSEMFIFLVRLKGLL